MASSSSDVTVADFFCGAGGFTTGAMAAGARVVVAANHWDRAIETHNTNYPDIEHYLADISASDARSFPKTTGFIGSPECTNHTLAKGKKRKGLAQLDMFDEHRLPDEAEERSRCTMWDPLRLASVHNYEFVVLENVVDVRFWSEWENWVRAWQALDYMMQLVYLNSMFAHPTPQSRDRLYIVLTRRKNKRPALKITPKAYCAKCEEDILAVQSWKDPMKPFGKYGKSGQYIYRCPICATQVYPYYYAAANAIDWALPTTRIGDRKRPLEEKTIARIKLGLERFRGHIPFFIDVTKSTDRVRSVTDTPFPTQTGTHGLGMVNPPFLMGLSYSSNETGYVYSPEEPFPTQTARQTMALVEPPPASPFVFSMNHSQMQGANIMSEAMPTRTTFDDTSLVMTPPFMVELRAHSTARSLEEPLATLCAGGTHHALITPPVPQPFIIDHIHGYRLGDLNQPMPTLCGMDHKSVVLPAWLMTYYSNGQMYPVESHPTSTVTTVDRQALVTAGENGEIDYEDCGFRMLEPREIQAAMAFPTDYKITGNRREQVKQLGNACTPPAIERIMIDMLASLDG